MFDHCDDDARAVIHTALAESRRLGHSWLGTEHILVALTIHHADLPEPVTRLLPTTDQVRDALSAVVDPMPATPNAELLGTLGIDLDQVRVAVRETFGPEALDRLAHRRVHQPWQPWRRPTRACVSLLADHHSVAPRLKQALEHATRDAARRQRSLVDPIALFQGVLEVQDALANRLLDELRVASSDLRAAIHAAS